MSLISGSNSLTPATAGALDFRAAIVENALVGKTIGCDLELCSEYDEVFVRIFPLKQREKDLCCRSCRIAVRLTVLSKEDMSDTLTGHNMAIKVRENSNTIGVNMELARQEEPAALGDNVSALGKIIIRPA